MSKTYNRPVHTAMAALFLIFKKPRTTYELAELLDARPDQIRQSMRIAESEGLITGNRAVMPKKRSPPPVLWQKAE
jgi:predicted transcriptional regulator